MARLAHQIAPGAAGQTLIDIIPCGAATSYDSDTPLITGQFEFDPSDHEMEGATLSLTFRATGANGQSPLTTNVQLYNLTDTEQIALLQFVDTTTPGKQEAALTIGAGAGEVDNAPKLYEVRIWVTAPGDPADTIELGSAELRVVNTITG
jgi:hypothetical protein